MHDKDGVAHDARRVAARLAKGVVVKPQFRERLARAKLEIAQPEIALVRWRIVGGRSERDARETEDGAEKGFHWGRDITQMNHLI